MKQINKQQVYQYANASQTELLDLLHTSLDGLSDEEVHCRLHNQKQQQLYLSDSLFVRIKRSFINPFTIILSFIAVLSFLVDVVLKAPMNRNYMSFIIIIIMLLISGSIRFIQELKAKKVSDQVIDLLNQTVCVKRNGNWTVVDASQLVKGDYIRVPCGEQLPADMRILHALDCFISEAVITGESAIYQKQAIFHDKDSLHLRDYTNIAFGGTTVVSGSCEGFLFAIGSDSFYGNLLYEHVQKKKGFDQGANEIAWVLIRFMIILVPLVFLVSGVMNNQWMLSLIFALSVAVGLTPELLPMVITACLTKGSFAMSKKQTIVKNVNAMQGFGNMDVLCVDKTGTLTSDRLWLEYYMDVLGNENSLVLDYAYMNSYYQDGIQNHLDQAILDVRERTVDQSHYNQLTSMYEKVDVLPFDYNRKLTSVLVESETKKLMIVKGNLEQVLQRCKKVRYRDAEYDIEEDALRSVYAVVDEMLEDGMKVLAIAYKELDAEKLSMEDECDFILLGYIAFFDAPKKSAERALKQLQSLHINVKILTGDHIRVSQSICRRLYMDDVTTMKGEEFDALTDAELLMSVEKTVIFAQLTPIQKQKIVDILQANGHVVGFLGDGLNDLPAVLQADVGISVDTANACLKDAADVILLKKDLQVLESGILEGRKAFANMSKYIKITASSNLGNMIAIVIASLCLPFFPMTSIQLLLLNLLYDGLCLILPWDHVDEKMLEEPLEWSGHTLSRFMLWFGPISSFFDMITFLFLYFILCPYLCGGSFSMLTLQEQSQFISIFQTGWFLESMWTQILILYLLRTEKIPLLQSKPSKAVWMVTLFGIICFTFIAMTPIGSFIGMTSLPLLYFIFLIVIVSCYLVMITVIKNLYLSKYKKLL